MDCSTYLSSKKGKLHGRFRSAGVEVAASAPKMEKWTEKERTETFPRPSYTFQTIDEQQQGTNRGELFRQIRQPHQSNRQRTILIIKPDAFLYVTGLRFTAIIFRHILYPSYLQNYTGKYFETYKTCSSSSIELNNTKQGAGNRPRGRCSAVWTRRSTTDRKEGPLHMPSEYQFSATI